MTTLNTIGSTTHSMTSFFQNAIILNEPSLAYDILQTVLGDDFYPKDAQNEWTDILVKDNEYFACFADDSLMTDTSIIYIQIEPTNSMIQAYDYLKT